MANTNNTNINNPSVANDFSYTYNPSATIYQRARNTFGDSVAKRVLDQLGTYAYSNCTGVSVLPNPDLVPGERIIRFSVDSGHFDVRVSILETGDLNYGVTSATDNTAIDSSSVYGGYTYTVEPQIIARDILETTGTHQHSFPAGTEYRNGMWRHTSTPHTPYSYNSKSKLVHVKIDRKFRELSGVSPTAEFYQYGDLIITLNNHPKYGAIICVSCKDGFPEIGELLEICRALAPNIVMTFLPYDAPQERSVFMIQAGGVSSDKLSVLPASVLTDLGFVKGDQDE